MKVLAGLVAAVAFFGGIGVGVYASAPEPGDDYATGFVDGYCVAGWWGDPDGQFACMVAAIGNETLPQPNVVDGGSSE